MYCRDIKTVLTNFSIMRGEEDAIVFQMMKEMRFVALPGGYSESMLAEAIGTQLIKQC
jgi:hypothetical protein